MKLQSCKTMNKFYKYLYNLWDIYQVQIREDLSLEIENENNDNGLSCI